jgi:hypothetical protein
MMGMASCAGREDTEQKGAICGSSRTRHLARYGTTSYYLKYVLPVLDEDRDDDSL